MGPVSTVTVTDGLVAPQSLLGQVPRIVRLYADCFGLPPWNEDRTRIQRFAAGLPALLKQERLRVASVADDGRLAAMADPSYRRQGLGQAVLRRLTAHDNAWLLTHRDGAGSSFYAAAGWYRTMSFCGENDVPLERWMHPH